MERGEDPCPPAGPDPPGRAEEAAEQRGSQETVRREIKPGHLVIYRRTFNYLID